MLLFSTILEVNESMGKNDFIKLVIEWNQKSPHPQNVIQEINWQGERNIRFGSEDLWLAIEEYRNENIIAVRFEKREEDGVIWDTDYVMNFNSRKMAIRLDKSYLEGALSFDPKFSTPHFITLLIERGYLKNDGDLPILNKPIVIGNDKIEQLAQIINGKLKYRLPVVYVSKSYYDKDPVNVGHLAYSLKGVAHVLLQESNCSNNKLKRCCDGKNEYYGAVGIYYSNSAIRHKKYLYHGSNRMDDILLERVIRSVIQNENIQRVDTLYTWQGVNNALLKDRLDSQFEERKKAEQEKNKILDSLSETERQIREKVMSDAEKLLDSFDEDIERWKRQIDELQRVNESLQNENQVLRASLNTGDMTPLLYMGDEYDFYPGEVKDLLLTILSENYSKLNHSSRRAHIVKDLIAQNDFKEISVQRAKSVKKLLKDYKGITGPIRQELEELGFQITEEGKHYKLTYFEDERYQVVFAKTPSDLRAGKNNASNIKQKVY